MYNANGNLARLRAIVSHLQQRHSHAALQCPKQASSPHNGSLAVNADRGWSYKEIEMP